MTTYHQILIGGIFLLVALVVGVLFERLLVALLKRFAARIEWRSVGIATSALRGMIVISFVLLGAWAATEKLALSTDYVHRGAVLLAIALGSIAVARLAAGFVRLYGERNEALLPATSIFSNIAAIVAMTIGLLVSLQYLEIPITPILTALGVGGLAVALALKDTLTSLFAGLQIIASREVKPGDYIKLDTGEEGYILDISWRHTIIRALQNNLVIVPNSKLAGATITNFHLPDKEIAVTVAIKVGYENNLTHVEEITVEVAKEVQKTTEGAVKEFEPFIRYHTFAETGVEFTVVMRASEFSAQFLMKHEFVQRAVHRYAEKGIAVAVPPPPKTAG